jgi:hypothetical protein
VRTLSERRNPVRGFGYVQDNFQVPHPAPEPVEKASAKFEELAAAYREAQAEYYGRVTSRLDDIRAANSSAAAARISGTKISGRTEAKIDADIAKAKAEMDVLEQAVDQAGDHLANLVLEHKAEWLAVLDAADAEATARVEGLTATLKQATHDVGMARGASKWLRDFRSITDVTQYPGGSGHTAVNYDALEKLVNGERVLVGYREGQPIWETKKVGA